MAARAAGKPPVGKVGSPRSLAPVVRNGGGPTHALKLGAARPAPSSQVGDLAEERLRQAARPVSRSTHGQPLLLLARE